MSTALIIESAAGNGKDTFPKNNKRLLGMLNTSQITRQPFE